jgi:hypothetical protein
MGNFSGFGNEVVRGSRRLKEKAEACGLGLKRAVGLASKKESSREGLNVDTINRH